MATADSLHLPSSARTSDRCGSLPSLPWRLPFALYNRVVSQLIPRSILAPERFRETRLIGKIHYFVCLSWCSRVLCLLADDMMQRLLNNRSSLMYLPKHKETLTVDSQNVEHLLILLSYLVGPYYNEGNEDLSIRLMVFWYYGNFRSRTKNR